MQYMSGSYLSYLMNALSISGNELADVLNVHYTLISKWRTGKRFLKVKSPIFKKLVEYILMVDSKNNYSQIRLLLLPMYPTASQADKKELCVFLTKELTRTSNPHVDVELGLQLQNDKDVSCENYYVFKGNSGKMKAIRKIMNMATSQVRNIGQYDSALINSGPLHSKELLVVLYDIGFWSNKKESSYITTWQKLIKSFINQGGIVHLIRTGMRNSDELSDVAFFWLPLVLTGNVIEYTWPFYDSFPVNYSILLLKDEAFLVDFHIKKLSEQISTNLFLDINAVNICQNLVQSFICQGTPIYQIYKTEHNRKLVNYLLDAFEPGTNVYFYSYMPPLALISPCLMNQILEYNNVSYEQKVSFQEFFTDFHESFIDNLSTNVFRQFIDLPRARQYLEKEECVSALLSVLLGKIIKIRREMVISMFIEFIQYIRAYQNLKVCVTDSQTFPSLDDMIVMVGQNTGLMFYRDNEFSICTTRMPVQILSCYAQFEKVFNSTIGDKKNKEKIIRSIEDLLLSYQVHYQAENM